jgi:TonB family protein
LTRTRQSCRLEIEMRLIVISVLGLISASVSFCQTEPATAEEFLARAQQSLGPKQFDRVIEDCTQALALEPELFEALLLRATAYSNLNQREKAIADLDSVIRAYPRASTFVFRGNQNMLLSRYEAAAADFTQAIKRTPSAPAPYELRANARQQLGDARGASEDRMKAAQLGSVAPSTNSGGAPMRIGGGVSAPKIVDRAAPAYSEEARVARIQGNVVLSVVIDEQGLPRDLKVVRPLGYGLDEKAIEAVQHWKFQPGMKDGHPVTVQSTIEVSFRLL